MELTQHVAGARAVSRGALWTGRILSALVVLFLLFSASLKLFLTTPALDGMVELGWPRELTLGLGVLELCCTLAYAWPRTAFPGAILVTGYLGGAVATHLRLLDPWLSHTLFPVWLGAIAWGGLALRDARVRALFVSRA